MVSCIAAVVAGLGFDILVENIAFVDMNRDICWEEVAVPALIAFGVVMGEKALAEEVVVIVKTQVKELDAV